MSTRYVWGKYNKAVEFEKIGTYELKLYYSGDLNSSTVIAYAASSITQKDDGTVDLSGSITPVYYSRSVNAATYHYIAFSKTGNYDYGYYPGGNAAYWFGSGKRSSGTPYKTVTILDNASDITSNFEFVQFVSTDKQGSFIANISSASKGAYPTVSGGGVSGNYWYTYKGSDNIDPTAITYPAEKLRPGDRVTVSITPRSNTYGGTISYLYQYSANGGSWTTIQTTTATSVSFTVPANAQSVRFRVRAQDDMGFTSSTYAVSGISRH